MIEGNSRVIVIAGVLVVLLAAIAVVVVAGARQPTSTCANQACALVDEVQIKCHHEVLDLLIDRSVALQSNLTDDNIGNFRGSYLYYLGRLRHQNLIPCLQAKVDRVHRVLDDIQSSHEQDFQKMLHSMEVLPQKIIFNSTSRVWSEFDQKFTNLRRKNKQIQIMIDIAKIHSEYRFKERMVELLDSYALRASQASPAFASSSDVNEWILLLPSIFADVLVLNAAENGARFSFRERCTIGLNANDEAEEYLQRLKSYIPVKNPDHAFRLNYFQSLQTGLDDAIKQALSPSFIAQIHHEQEIVEVKFLASEAVWAHKQLLSNGLTQSYGNVPDSPLPEYERFMDKWNLQADKHSELEYLYRSVQAHYAKLKQLKIALGTEEIFRFHKARNVVDGSCWRLFHCLQLQNEWNRTYQTLPNRIETVGDEFDIDLRIQKCLELAEMELDAVICRLKQIRSTQASPFCPGPSICMLKQMARQSHVLPDHLNSSLKTVWKLRTELGWGEQDRRTHETV